jgi:catechol 2,3-dioxygenase-like lactoylglutathione lyase family enzyme
LATVHNHVGQVVADLDRSVAFYVALGFVVDRELELPDEVVGPFLGVATPCGFTAVYLAAGDFQLELMRFGEGPRPPAATRVFDEPGLTHLSLSVDDLEAANAAVVEHGGTVVSSSSRSSIVRDPDGQLLELLSMDFHERTRGGSGARR